MMRRRIVEIMKYDKYKDEIIYEYVICISAKQILRWYERPDQAIRMLDYTQIAN